ncbi:MAG: carbohydrate porin [Cyanobacteria bacterium SBLK]|nr:carbohydrate porin [Cyanobacteria bacterium SBLK]
MFKLCEILSKSSAIALYFALCSATSAIAVEIFPLDPIDSEAIDTLEEDPLAELTSVRQLSDVEPTDWAYDALQSLIERYGAIAGYPNLTFRGDRVLSRYEFAAALNTLTGRIEELIAKTTSDLALREDIEILKRLQTEFAEELAVVGTQVDALESRVTQLEENTFSTTTKLSVQAFFHISGITATGDITAEGTSVPVDGFSTFRLAARDPVTNQPVTETVTDSPEITLGEATLIFFNTSFTGRDLLSLNLFQANTDPPSFAFHSANFPSAGFHLTETNPIFPLVGSVGILEAFYQFPIGDSVNVVIGPAVRADRYFDTIPYTNYVSGAGMLSSLFSPLFVDVTRLTGAVVNWKISPQWELHASYRVDRNEASQEGFFDALGKFANLTFQLNYSPSNNATIRFGYDRALIQGVDPGSGLATRLSNNFIGAADDGFGGELQDTFSHNFLINFDWQLSDRFVLFGRYSYSTYHLTPRTPGRSEGDVEAQSFQLGMAFPDLWKEGALLTVDAVIPFNILSGRDFVVSGNGDGGTQINLSANYFFPINDNVSVMPTIFGVFNTNNFNSNPFVYGGFLRTQFLF